MIWKKGRFLNRDLLHEKMPLFRANGVFLDLFRLSAPLVNSRNSSHVRPGLKFEVRYLPIKPTYIFHSHVCLYNHKNYCCVH